MIDVDELDALPGEDIDFDAAWQAVEPEDPLYTPGTTGDPEGVVLTHATMLFTMRSYDAVLGFERGARLSKVEQIKRFTVLDEEWQPGGDELTPTM